MRFFFISILFLISGKVFGWGNTGHRVVGEIATKFLQLEVRVRAQKILKGESLARVSTWPDEIKSEPATYSHTFNWHYTTWQTEDHEHSEHEESASTGFLLKSIAEQTAILKDPSATDDQKAFSLKFLVHLIADLHQPLHVGNGTDQGGNTCKVIFHGRPTNLHALWDEGMIDFTKLSYTEFARFIIEAKTPEDMQLARTGSVVDWARESKQLVPAVYPENVVQPQVPQSMRTYCHREVRTEEMPVLGYQYSYRFQSVVEKRLLLAGIRLAVLLNQNLK